MNNLDYIEDELNNIPNTVYRYTFPKKDNKKGTESIIFILRNEVSELRHKVSLNIIDRTIAPQAIVDVIANKWAEREVE